MGNTMISIRVDEDLKKEAETILGEMGMNMTTALTIFLKTVIRQRSIPFEIKSK